MEPVELTVTKTTSIDHNDADAAGFTDGYRWSFTSPFGDFASCAPTKAAAQAAGEAAVRGQGYEVA